MAGTYQREHPSYCCAPSVPTNNEVFSAYRFRRIENLLWREVILSMYDGARTREQSGPTVMDPAECSLGDDIQATKAESNDSGPHLSRAYPHNGRTFRG